MNLSEALREVWVAIDDLEMLASALDPEDQLDEDEVERGLTNRGDRYAIGDAAAVIDHALVTALRLAEAVEWFALGARDEDALDALRARGRTVVHAFEGWSPDVPSRPCRGCPCVEQGGSPCCFCGRTGEEHA